MSLAQDSGESDVDVEHGRNATASLPDRRAEAAVADLLLALGRDLGDPDLFATPRRVVAAFREMLDREPLTMTTFPNEQGYDDLVLVREIPFTSLCAHRARTERGRRRARGGAPVHVHPRTPYSDGSNPDRTIHRGARRPRVGALRRRVAATRRVTMQGGPS